MSEETKFDRARTIDSIVYIMNEILDDNGIEQLCLALVGIIEKQSKHDG